MSKPTKSIKVHFAEAIFGLVFMACLGAGMAIGLDYQLRVEQSITYEGAAQ